MQAFRNLSANATKLGFVFCEIFFVFITVKSFSAKTSGCVTYKCFFNCGWLANAEEISEGGSEKSGLRKVSGLLPLTCQLCTFDLQILGVELFPVVGKFPRQKHHDLAGKFGVWHVMCIRIPISCRSWTCGDGMAHDVRSTSLGFLCGWRNQCL